MEPIGWSLCSKEPATAPNPEPHESSPHPISLTLQVTSVENVEFLRNVLYATPTGILSQLSSKEIIIGGNYLPTF
jgi:hypothetical protein